MYICSNMFSRINILKINFQVLSSVKVQIYLALVLLIIHSKHLLFWINIFIILFFSELFPWPSIILLFIYLFPDEHRIWQLDFLKLIQKLIKSSLEAPSRYLRRVEEGHKSVGHNTKMFNFKIAILKYLFSYLSG